MRGPSIRYALLVTAVVALLAPAAYVDDSGWTVGGREIPLPAAASDALRDSIAATGQPTLERNTAPATVEEWKAWIAKRDAERALPLDMQATMFKVTFEKATVNGVKVYRVTPNTIAREHTDRMFLHLHGGGYALAGGDGAPGEAAVIAGRLGIPAISVDYRMPPEHPYPAAPNDAVAVYEALLETHKPGSIFIGGTSAGGGLTLATLLQIRDQGLPMPGAAYLGTPWADLTNTSDSLHTNAGIDRILVQYEPMLAGMARLYAGEYDLTEPGISPVYGDFTGFPPTYLVSGTRDMLLSDTVRVHRKLRALDIPADLHVYEGMSHADYLFVLNAPESAEYLRELGLFLNEHLK